MVRKELYEAHAQALEALKKEFFNYDPDSPPVLTRKQIISKQRWFGVLRDPAVNSRWEEAILEYLRLFPAQIFTVVIDKKAHFESYPVNTWNPYAYSLKVLLRRVRGYIKVYGGVADIMPEARGDVEDNQLLASYIEFRADGDQWGSGAEYQEVFPEERLLFRRKDQNIAGLQIADMVAAEQKLLTVSEATLPLPRTIGAFGARINEAIEAKVNQYGRYLLE